MKASTPLRCLIVDDEPLARDRLRRLLRDERDVEIAAECADGRKAVAAIVKLAPDLVFLDVQMPGLDGFGVLEALPSESIPAVIFVTAYDQYALRAFDSQALDYLLKPFDRERFQRALGRAREELRKRHAGTIEPRLLALLEQLEEQKPFLERLCIKSAGRVYFLRADDVDWIEAEGNYVRLHAGKEAHLLRETMNHLETRLDPQRFLRIHRSTIANIERIKELHPWFKGEHVVILRDGSRLTLGRAYRDRLARICRL